MQYRLIDSHTHVQFAAFSEDADIVIRRALDAGVGMILVGSQIDTSRRAVEFANKYPDGVYAAIGLHPIHLVEGHWDHQEIGAPRGVISGFRSRKEEFNYDAYKALGQDSKVIAIGECGIDYFRLPHEENDRREVVEKQGEVFKAHIRLASELKKPLMIHCRDAYADLLEILRSYSATYGSKLRGNMHFFAGSWNEAKNFLDLGFTLSFTGVITFPPKAGQPRADASEYKEIVEFVPMDKILVETDAPFAAPVPYRGKRNEPAYVEFIARQIAEWKGVSFDKVAVQTHNNAKALFKI